MSYLSDLSDKSDLSDYSAKELRTRFFGLKNPIPQDNIARRI